LNLKESNEIFRRAIIKTYFEPLIPFNIKLPDYLKGPDYFTTISILEDKHFWRHRELIRFKYGKSKKLLESLEFIDKKYRELSKAIHDSSVINKS
jgi:hypothetical protein